MRTHKLAANMARPVQAVEPAPVTARPSLSSATRPLAYGISTVQRYRAPAQMAGELAEGHPHGLPARLRQGVEALSGVPMHDVRVRRSSPNPAKLGAAAYAQGNEIFIGPGQDRHLPHEAWHIAQQKQGRVRATGQVAGTPVNDDPKLEREADSMGARALHTAPSQLKSTDESDTAGSEPAQCKDEDWNEEDGDENPNTRAQSGHPIFEQ